MAERTRWEESEEASKDAINLSKEYRKILYSIESEVEIISKALEPFLRAIQQHSHQDSELAYFVTRDVRVYNQAGRIKNSLNRLLQLYDSLQKVEGGLKKVNW